MTPAIAAPAYIPVTQRGALRVLHRAARVSDMAYVLRTWELSWKLSQRCRRLPGRDYRDLFRRMVREGLLREDDTRITIGCDESSPSRIWSWVCWTPGRVPTVHYAYTRAEVDGVPLRRSGLFRLMLAAIGVTDALIYTFEAVAQQSPHDRRPTGLTGALLGAADAANIAVLHRPIAEWLDMRRGS